MHRYSNLQHTESFSNTTQHINTIIMTTHSFICSLCGLFQNYIQGFFFDVSMSTKFELAIVVLIVANMIAMAVEHYEQSEAYSQALDLMNIIFTTIFTLEAIVKIIGMRWHYFRRPWNVYDFIIVIVSIVGK